MLLDEACRAFGWPEPEQIWAPRGEGPKVYAEFTKSKIEAALRRRHPEVEVHTGIVVADPEDDATVAPLAMVCEFPLGAPDGALEEAHRLAWNFSRTALLITLEPQRLIAWSCCTPPHGTLQDRQVCTWAPGSPQSARWLLHIVGLITGKILQEQPEKFSPEGRADATLLANLEAIRDELMAQGLAREICHDLLARVIFTQFLFHRRDREGRPFFDRKLLEGRCGGALERVHQGLASILEDKGETYALFRWLDERFNGDLFPGKEGPSERDRERAWRAEEEAVTEEHLTLLADLVSGKIDVRRRQLALWPLYSFDVIPLEFISSVYEVFLGDEQKRSKAYYTPSHLVDYVLDAVLPWKSRTWDVKVLDPSCGSGIFLVKAFQRLIHRWRLANPGRDPKVSDIKPILAQNIVGVDRHPEAVRVACFSLYLAMADAIEPRYYLKRDKVFPPLRGTRLLARDFFDETMEGIRTEQDAGAYDLVVGNAPWGDKSVESSSDKEEKTGARRGRGRQRTLAQVWADSYSWPVVNGDLGPLFLAKGAALAREGGQVAMIQSASLLNLRSEEASKLRERLFGSFTFDEVTNFSVVRDGLFKGAYGSCAALVFRPEEPAPEQTMAYLCPKPLHNLQSQHRLAIDPQDVHRITHEEAVDARVWSVLLLGGRRDLVLVQRLSRRTTLAELQQRGEVLTRQGVIPGNRRRLLDGHVEVGKRGLRAALPDLRGAPYLDRPRFPEGFVLHLDPREVPPWDDPRTDDTHSVNFEAFRDPQLLVKMSYSRRDGRWRAARVRETQAPWGIICKKTYLTVRDLRADGRRLDTACVVFNSKVVTWYLALTSSRLGHNRPEVLVSELLDVPLPEGEVALAALESFDELDAAAMNLYGLTEADRLLIEDCVVRTLPQAQSESPLSGYRPTRRSADPPDGEPDLAAYAQCVLRVLQSTFGERRRAAATVYEEAGTGRLPVRMVALTLDGPATGTVTTEPMTADGLLEALQGFHDGAMRARTRGGAVVAQRVALLFERRSPPQEGLNVYIVKPDQRRYWTRSLALHDADQLSSAILMSARHEGGRA